VTAPAASDRVLVVAALLAGSRWRQHLLFALASAVAVIAVGYHVGTGDQSIHLPFLARWADPSLFPGDRFLDLRHTHYSFFWLLFVPVAQAGVLAATMLVVHVIATYLTFWAFYALARTLWNDPLAALLAVVVLLLPHLSFGAFPLFEFLLLPRTFVLPFTLLAMILHLRGRFQLACAVLGVVFNLHVISAGLMMVLLGFDALRRGRRLGPTRLLGGAALFVAAAAPVLGWWLTSPQRAVAIDRDWLRTVSDGALQNAFALVSPHFYVWICTVSSLGGLAMIWLARRGRPRQAHDRAVDSFVLAGLGVLAVQVVTTTWLPVVAIVQAQILRVGVPLLILGYLHFAELLSRTYREGGLDRAGLAVLTAATTLLSVAAFPVVLFAGRRVLARAAVGRALAPAVIGGLVVVNVTVALAYDAWRPGVYPGPGDSAWVRCQMWARDHTPRDAVFVTPPHLWWLYLPDWRVHSERSTVVTLSELLEIAFAPEYAPVWRERFEALVPGAQARFAGDYFANARLTGEVYRGLPTNRLLEVARRYGASFAVVERPSPHPLPVAWENEGFVVHDVSRAAVVETGSE
jgi:hypothetical protein